MFEEEMGSSRAFHGAAGADEPERTWKIDPTNLRLFFPKVKRVCSLHVFPSQCRVIHVIFDHLMFNNRRK